MFYMLSIISSLSFMNLPQIAIKFTIPGHIYWITLLSFICPIQTKFGNNYNVYQTVQLVIQQRNIHQQIMSSQDKVRNKESQWQGFEHFHDHQEKQTLKISMIKQNPQINTNIKSNRSSVSPTKNRTFVSKTKKNRSEKQPLPQFQKKSKQENKRQASPQKQKVAEKKKASYIKYQRIPILKFQDHVRSCCSIVYRGFVPRSSDNYFRLIKEVDFETPIPQQNKSNHKKIPDMIQFNSKFEGGNLNIACRGF